MNIQVAVPRPDHPRIQEEPGWSGGSTLFNSPSRTTQNLPPQVQGNSQKISRHNDMEIKPQSQGTGLQTSSHRVSATANLASTTITETPEIEQIGSQTVEQTAESSGYLAAGATASTMGVMHASAEAQAAVQAAAHEAHARVSQPGIPPVGVSWGASLGILSGRGSSSDASNHITNSNGGLRVLSKGRSTQ